MGSEVKMSKRRHRDGRMKCIHNGRTRYFRKPKLRIFYKSCMIKTYQLWLHFQETFGYVWNVSSFKKYISLSGFVKSLQLIKTLFLLCSDYFIVNGVLSTRYLVVFDSYCSLLDDIVLPPMFDICPNCVILDFSQ